MTDQVVVGLGSDSTGGARACVRPARSEMVRNELAGLPGAAPAVLLRTSSEMGLLGLLRRVVRLGRHSARILRGWGSVAPTATDVDGVGSPGRTTRADRPTAAVIAVL
jgi:hypothetical protein